MNHDTQTCEFCSRAHWLMRADCVADELALAPVTVRLGQGGTSCLYKRRIKQGSNTYWQRRQVEEHKRQLSQKGKCNDCAAVLKEDSPLHAMEREAVIGKPN